MSGLRRAVSFLCVTSALIFSAGWASLASASVPGVAFTETGCEGSSDSVARLYRAGLGRDPDQDGFEFWMKEYTAGQQTFRSMAAFFADSPEFELSYGSLTNTEFVEQLYRNILGRQGDPGGVAFWSDELDKSDARATILMRFAESPENIAKSGTSAPTLGQYNEGRSVRWTCAGWEPSGGPVNENADACRVTGRNSIRSTQVRLTLTNPTAVSATASVLVEGMVDGVPSDDQYITVRFIGPGETVDEDSTLLGDVFDTPALESVTCGILRVRWWDPEPVVGRSGVSCRLTRPNVVGTWGVEISATNPLGVQADARLAILPYLDGRRVDHQFASLDGVAAGSQAFRQTILFSDRTEGVDVSRLRCDLLTLSWVPSG